MNTKGQKRREPGVDEPLHDRYHPSDNEEHDDDSEDDSYSSSDLGVEDADTAGNASAMSSGPNGGNQSIDNPNAGIKHQATDLSPNDNQPRASQATDRTNTTATTNGSSQSSKDYKKQNKRAEERKHRGLMQWKPARNARFAKNEAKIGLSKLKKKVTGGLDGRQPGVETGTCPILVLKFSWRS